MYNNIALLLTVLSVIIGFITITVIVFDIMKNGGYSRFIEDEEEYKNGEAAKKKTVLAKLKLSPSKSIPEKFNPELVRVLQARYNLSNSDQVINVILKLEGLIEDGINSDKNLVFISSNQNIQILSLEPSIDSRKSSNKNKLPSLELEPAFFNELLSNELTSTIQ